MFNNCNVVVFGSGISGVGAVRVLTNEGAKVALYDQKKINLSDEDQAFFTKHNVQLIVSDDLFGSYDINSLDYLVMSPGVPFDNAIVHKANEHNVEVIGEVEVASRLSVGKIVAVTGTNGKTTTTTLLAKMIATLPVKSAVGGNIGEALSLAAKELASQDDLLVAEISSFQLEGTKSFKPHIAAILNMTPDHLDRHKTFDSYVEIKAKVFANQGVDDFLILNADDKVLVDLASKAKSQVVFFSSKKTLAEGAFVENGLITILWQGKKEVVCAVSAMKLFGLHNVENALVACLCAYFAGVSVESMKEVLTTFEGVEHRIEYTGTVNGVRYYNDSKATNPESSIKALEAFEGHVILIAGGYDKLTDLTEFMSLAKEKCDNVIFLGNAKERFKSEAQRIGVENIHVVECFEDSVKVAHDLAKQPQVVLFSPACSSYDMFDNYEQRGRYFKQLVGEL